jgi:hypothetical protein
LKAATPRSGWGHQPLARGLSGQQGIVVVETHRRRREQLPPRVEDEFRPIPPPDADQAVGGTQINADDHEASPERVN